MESGEKTRQVILVAAFAFSLVFVGLLRYAVFHDGVLTPLSGYATPLYVALTVIFALLMGRSGIQLNRFGFGTRIHWKHVAWALGAVALLQLASLVIDPALESLFGTGRDLGRFADVEGSIPALLSVLALSWTFAAFGEEVAFRIVLLLGLMSVLGKSNVAVGAAVLLQAVVFGLVHLYQGPAGIVSSAISGLVFGTAVVLARGAIWPAALAHGTNNTIGLLMIYQGMNS